MLDEAAAANMTLAVHSTGLSLRNGSRKPDEQEVGLPAESTPAPGRLNSFTETEFTLPTTHPLPTRKPMISGYYMINFFKCAKIYINIKLAILTTFQCTIR